MLPHVHTETTTITNHKITFNTGYVALELIKYTKKGILLKPALYCCQLAAHLMMGSDREPNKYTTGAI